MQKILSVSIASYNVESYLPKALDSCLIPEIMDKLEVIVVNDGSKDNTAAVAQSYVDKWPGTFRLINKENGGYGSTVNASIRVATGKYFRLLDGDDWFDKDELIKFVHALEYTEEDMIVAKFKRVFEDDGHIEERDETKGITFKTLLFEEIQTEDWFTMHAVSYRAALLRKYDITLTEHCFYTDQEYDLLPLKWVKAIRFVPYSVYCYRIGRGEQSISPAGLEKHYQEQTIVLKRLYSIYANALNSPKNTKDKYILKYLLKRTNLHIWNYILISKSDLHKKELKEFIKYLKFEQPIFYRKLLKTSHVLRVLVFSNYVLYGVMHEYKVRKYRF